MGLLKKRKKYIWCTEIPLDITPSDFKRGKDVPKIKKVKCPECGKKFNPRIRECNDNHCWHVYIPAHKKIVKV